MTENENKEKVEVVEEIPVTEAETVKDAATEEPKDKKPGKSKKSAKELEAEITELEIKVDRLEDELLLSQEKFLRIAAEYENFRKRSAKEKEGIYADAYADCIGAILPVIDNLERALQFSEGDKVVEGVRMTLNQFVEILAKMGVEVIPTETFDPMLHNAVMHVEDDAFGENAIVEVFQKGYKKGDKIIRYAMVKVAN